MLFRGMVQGFYISRYITADGSIVTPVEKNIVMSNFQMSASRRCFLCLRWQIPLARSPHSTGVDILSFFFFFFTSSFLLAAAQTFSVLSKWHKYFQGF